MPRRITSTSTGSSGALYIKGNLTINTGAVDSLCSGYPVVVYGNIVNNGTMRAALTPSTIVFGGSTTQTVSGSSPLVANGGFVSLNPGGVNFLTDAYVTGGAVQTTGTYTYDSSGGKMVTFPVAGVINTGSSTMYLNPAGGQTMNEGTNPVQGNVSSTRTLLQNSNTDFGNGFQMDALGGVPGSTTVLRKTGVADSGYAHDKSILKHYDVTDSNNTALNATIVVGYSPSLTELNGISATNLLLQKSTDNGATWAGKKGTLDTVTNHTITATGVSSPGAARWTMASAMAPLFVPHAIVIRSFKDTVGTVAPQVAQKWRLALYQDSVSASTLQNSGFSNSGILGTTYLASGTYILAENDSAGWVHLGRILHGTSIGNSVVSSTSRFDTIIVTDASPNSADTVDFVNQQVSSITVVKLRDYDGRLSTTGDQLPQSWHLSLYKGSVSGSNLIDSVNNSTLVATNLPGGSYIAVEADSGAPWYRLNGNHTLSDTLTIAANQSIADTFINLKGNALSIQKYVDADGKFATTGDRTLKNWYLSVYRDSATGTLVTSGSATGISANNLGNGNYYISEADSTGWVNLGYVVNGAGTSSATDHILVYLSNGLVDSVSFVNAPPIYSQTFRSFRPDSIANAGVAAKAVDLKKPDKVQFTVTVHNDSANITGLHMEFAVALYDSSIRAFTVNPPATKKMTDTKSQKWDFTFASPIGASTPVTVSGWGTAGKLQTAKYHWLRNGVKVGKTERQSNEHGFHGGSDPGTDAGCRERAGSDIQ